MVAAYAAVETDFVAAAAIALAAYGLAGEIAARTARGPGSLHVGLYDALAGLTEESLQSRPAYRGRTAVKKMDLRVYVVTAEIARLGRTHEDVACAAVTAGTTVIQFRDKFMDDALFAATAERVRSLRDLSCGRTGGIRSQLPRQSGAGRKYRSCNMCRLPRQPA